LLAQAFDKPVVDEPRLGGEDDVFSFTLQWEPGVAEAGQLPDRATLARALEEQLGLSLREAERLVERLIVDALAEQPVGLWVPPSPGAQ
jgi:uncharacterized protein (TIGR03435 family)